MKHFQAKYELSTVAIETLAKKKKKCLPRNLKAKEKFGLIFCDQRKLMKPGVLFATLYLKLMKHLQVDLSAI